MVEARRSYSKACLLLTCLLAAGGLLAGEAGGESSIQLPKTTDLGKFCDLVANLTGVSMQYDPGKLRGQVRLEVQRKVAPPELWAIFNQVLAGQGFTTVVTGEPPVFQVVQISQAAELSRVLEEGAENDLTFLPGYLTLLVTLEHAGADPVAKALGAVLSGRSARVQAMGDDARRLVIGGVRSRVEDARRVLALLDRPGATPALRAFTPERADPAALQGAVKTAWAAMNRITGERDPLEVQLAPDGKRLLVIAAADRMDGALAMLAELDASEPVDTRTYRPRYFAIADVAQLLEQMLQTKGRGRADDLRIVRNDLTQALMVTGTGAQHARVAALLEELNAAPEEARRQVRRFVVRNRPVDDVAGVLSNMIDGGLLQGDIRLDEAGAVEVEAPASEEPPAAGRGPANPPPEVLARQRSEAARAAGAGRTGAGGQPGLVITTDPQTSSILAMGEPRLLARLEELIVDLDRRQPQVELEVIMLSLSTSESRDLGVELMHLFRQGQTTTVLASLFGLGGQGTAFETLANISNRTYQTVFLPGTGIPFATNAVPFAPAAYPGSYPTGTGLNGAVINAGDFAAVVRALETVTDGESLIRGRMVVGNNVEASLSGVIQEPYSSINASDTVSTTSFGGTSDAGTDLALTPQIGAGDHIDLAYTISQSSFIGDSVVTESGVTPPPKRSDTLSASATIPDSYVIALGGLSSLTGRWSESRIPIIGAIPLLGRLFKSTSKTESDNKFYVFIRVNILRHHSFEDLKHLSAATWEGAGLDAEGWPVPRCRFSE